MAVLGEWFQKVDALTDKSRPPGVIVGDLKPLGEQFKLAGVANTRPLVFQYAESIRRSGLFADVRVVEVSGASSEQQAGDGALGALEGGGSQAQATLAGGVRFTIIATAPLEPDESAEGNK